MGAPTVPGIGLHRPPNLANGHRKPSLALMACQYNNPPTPNALRFQGFLKASAWARVRSSAAPDRPRYPCRGGPTAQPPAAARSGLGLPAGRVALAPVERLGRACPPVGHPGKTASPDAGYYSASPDYLQPQTILLRGGSLSPSASTVVVWSPC